ncbi:MAG: hypothetical protein A2Z52_00060 [Candidatus Moranbacteria bacterium RBG_19FT_COMBO_42_6]|nr:MAG: hypothetical protein A2Z52_00060 [Candidatus Moranbacteria bacterium RBG_19FT_COMBO_42_6]
MSFDGTDAVNIGDPASGVLDFGASQNFTIAAWVKSSDLTRNYPMIISKNNFATLPRIGYNLVLHSSIDSSPWAVELFDDTGAQHWIDGNSNIADGQWHLLVAMRDGNTVRTYQDGGLMTEETDASYSGSLLNSQPLAFGKLSDGGLDFIGSLDDVRIYNYALSLAEVQALYNTAPTISMPTVSITSPASGATLSGTVTNVNALAYDPDIGSTDGDGIANVIFELINSGGTTVASTQENIVTYDWNPLDTTLYPDGNYTLKATATSTPAAGGTSSSTSIPITINNAPSATLIGHWKLDDGLGAEKIPNGNFGSNISGWQSDSGSGLSWQNAASGDGSTGYMRFNVVSNSNYDRFGYTSAGVTVASTTYAVSFWYRTSSGITGNLRAYSAPNISVLGTSASWAPDQITPSTAWRFYSTTLTTDAADFPMFGISKLGSIGSGTFDIDAISVKAISTTVLQAADSSGNNHTGNLTNGPTWTIGPVSGALNLDGTDDYVNLGAFNFGSVFTISAWVNINSGRTNIQTIMANSGSGSTTNGFRLFVNTYATSNQRLYIETGNGSGNNSANSADFAVPYPGWHHIVAIVDRAGGLANAYVDNVQVITNDGILTDFANNQTTHIGQMTNNTYRFGGKMDDVRIYSGALSAAEIQALYSAGTP